jgi:hypothetical protein
MTTPDAPKILQIPIGINASGTQRETDSMREIEVSAAGIGVRRHSRLCPGG